MQSLAPRVNDRQTERGGERNASLCLIRQMHKHPVVNTGPLRIRRVELDLADLTRLKSPPDLGRKAPQHAGPAAARLTEPVRMQARE